MPTSRVRLAHNSGSLSIVAAMSWSTASSVKCLIVALASASAHATRAAFEERLSENLRAYLKKLPDFEDVEAEDWAMRHALSFRNFSAALYFFHEWPNPAHAAQLVLDRASEIDGNAYYLLDPVARQIEGKHPLAATLLRRAMIDDTLEGAKSSRYKHAARHLL